MFRAIIVESPGKYKMLFDQLDKHISV